MKHTWHKEIKAWADGAEIQMSMKGVKFSKDYSDKWDDWVDEPSPQWNDINMEFRIKPQPKEPKYLYVYECENKMLKNLAITKKYNGYKIDDLSNGDYFYIGKIKLEIEE